MQNLIKNQFEIFRAQEKPFAMFTRKSQGKQKGERNRLKIDKIAIKRESWDFSDLLFFFFKPKFSLFKNI
jgi:hypothetical protein